MWTYKDKEVKEIPEGYIGFIYLISEKPEIIKGEHIVEYLKRDDKIYVGKKVFEHKRKTRISKREIAATKTRKRVKIVKKDSGWQAYQSSCLPLQQAIKQKGVKAFTFEILEFCKDKRELSYKEVWWMFKLNVLEVDSYNGNILGRFFKQKET